MRLLLGRRLIRRSHLSTWMKDHLQMKPIQYISLYNFKGAHSPLHILVVQSFIIFKVQGRLQSWKGKFLSIGGRAVLISHVLEIIPIHLLSAVKSPLYVIAQFHRIFAKFYWSNSRNGRARNWSEDSLCLPKNEGGLGFRSLHDVPKALFAKLW